MKLLTYLNRLKRFVNKSVDDSCVKDKVYNFDVIDYYYRSRKMNSNIVNDKTIDDIDFYEVFKFIDHTNSAVGQQYYFNKLLTVDYECNFDIQEKWINYLSGNGKVRNMIQNAISRVNDKESYYISNLFLDEYIKRPKYFSMYKILMILPLIFFVLTFVSNVFYFLLMFSIIANLILHYKNKKYIYLYKDSIPQLLKLHKCVKDVYSFDVFESNTLLVSSIKSIDEIKNRMFIFKIEKVGDSDVFELFFLIIEYLKIFFFIRTITCF